MLMIARGDHHSIQLRHGQQLFGVFELFHITAEAALAVGSSALAVQRPDVAHRHHAKVLLLLTHLHHVAMAPAATAATQKCQIDAIVRSVDSSIRQSTHG